MREADDAAVRRARVYIDTEGALKESGDLIGPIRSGALTEERIAGDLFGLCRGTAAGRGGGREITLFKATGTALSGSGGGDSRPHETRGRGMTGGPSHAHPRVQARV